MNLTIDITAAVVWDIDRRLHNSICHTLGCKCTLDSDSADFHRYFKGLLTMIDLPSVFCLDPSYGFAEQLLNSLLPLPKLIFRVRFLKKSWSVDNAGLADSYYTIAPVHLRFERSCEFSRNNNRDRM